MLKSECVPCRYSIPGMKRDGVEVNRNTNSSDLVLTTKKFTTGTKICKRCTKSLGVFQIIVTPEHYTHAMEISSTSGLCTQFYVFSYIINVNFSANQWPSLRYTVYSCSTLYVQMVNAKFIPTFRVGTIAQVV